MIYVGAPRADAALAACLGFAPLAAHAWGSLLLIDAPPAISTLAVGPSLWTLPAYPGAQHERPRLIPGIDYYAASGFFASSDSAVGWNFAPREKVQAGLRLWPHTGRSAHESPATHPAHCPRAFDRCVRRDRADFPARPYR